MHVAYNLSDNKILCDLGFNRLAFNALKCIWICNGIVDWKA